VPVVLRSELQVCCALIDSVEGRRLVLMGGELGGCPMTTEVDRGSNWKV
jgi:hypothetical protein